jgi:hypothetical protein
MAFPGSRTVCILLAGLSIGCQVEQGGLGSTTGATEGSSGGATTAADGTAGTSRGTDAGSGDATSGASTSASSTGAAEGTLGSTTESPPQPESTGGSETEGSSPGQGEPYGPCGPAGSCMGDDVVCYESDRMRNMCLPPCDGTNPSCPPAPPDNEALVECVQVMGVHCMLNCAAGGQGSCPEGTVCEEVFGGIFRCLWP